jgi:hypothetical protein
MGGTMPYNPERMIAFVATDSRGDVRIIDVLRRGLGHEFRTEHGQPVTRIRRGSYRLTGSDVELTSDDPEAV